MGLISLHVIAIIIYNYCRGSNFNWRDEKSPPPSQNRYNSSQNNGFGEGSRERSNGGFVGGDSNNDDVLRIIVLTEYVGKIIGNDIEYFICYFYVFKFIFS